MPAEDAAQPAPSTTTSPTTRSSPWSAEQVEAIAPVPATYSAAVQLAVPTLWVAAGADDRAVWGRYVGGRGEPYDVAVDHVAVATRCSCPSRRRPCKHALALLLLWVVEGVPPSTDRPAAVTTWVARQRVPGGAREDDADPTATGSGEPTDDRRGGRDTGADDRPVTSVGADGAHGSGGSTASAATDRAGGGDRDGEDPERDPDRDRARDERVERMFAGLVELDRWLEDRLRVGLADTSLTRADTWDELAARLVDAQAGSLANRIRRLMDTIGTTSRWHGDLLAELGVLHLLAQAGRRLGELPPELADRVATAIGWQVRQADVLAGVPDTDRWVVAGRSDTREDRIEVRRTWLRGTRSDRWALVLSFAAFQHSLDTSLAVGTAVEADLHRYPGRALRALVGRRVGQPEPARPPATTIAEAANEIGRQVAVEPWLDRVPATITAQPAHDGDQWWLTDDDGAFPVRVTADLPTVLAVSAGRPIDVTVEWTPRGVIPLAIHTTGAGAAAMEVGDAPSPIAASGVPETIDIGPIADPSFVRSTP